MITMKMMFDKGRVKVGQKYLGIFSGHLGELFTVFDVTDSGCNVEYRNSSGARNTIFVTKKFNAMNMCYMDDFVKAIGE